MQTKRNRRTFSANTVFMKKKKIKAAQYCKTCDEPDPLCNDCAKHHIRQKASRNHELCNDIEIFQIHQKGLNAK